MEKVLFNLDNFPYHSSLTIKEVDGQIVFVETLCFDYDTGEWDTFVATISQNDFIKGIKEFLKTGICRAGNLVMDTTRGSIHIFLPTEKRPGWCNPAVEWFIPKSEKKWFLDKLKEIIN